MIYLISDARSPFEGGPPGVGFLGKFNFLDIKSKYTNTKLYDRNLDKSHSVVSIDSKL